MKQPSASAPSGAVRGWSHRAARWPDLLARRLRRHVLAWPLAALAGLAVLAINETGHEHSMQALQQIQQRGIANTELQQLLRRLLDAETGQRGYLLTGRRVYLQPYEEAAADTQALLDRLQVFHARDAADAARLAELAQHAQARLAELASTLKAYDAGRRDASGLVMAGPSGGHMDAIRGLVEELVLAQSDALVGERQAVLQTLRASRWGVNLMACLGVLALLLVLRQARALERIQLRHAMALGEEQDQLEHEVARRTADLTQLARHLQTVREDEKSRLARTLSDELGALLTATQMDVLRLRHELGPQAVQAQARLAHLGDSIDSGISLKRRISEDLHPSSLANLGLVAALQIQAREFSERAGVPVATELAPLALAEAAEITAYRLVQEALTNVAKYARARRVSITLQRQGDQAVLCVQDDGRGFDPGARPRSAHGLMSMRYRVEAVGGGLHIHSTVGQGTRIEARLPLASSAAPTT